MTTIAFNYQIPKQRGFEKTKNHQTALTHGH